MHYVSAEGLTKSFGITPLFNNISFHINEGDKIALVARNGVGKSTLLRILSGKETADEGKLWINKDVTVALFEQDPQFEEDRSVLDNIFHVDHPVMKAIADYEMAADEENPTALGKAINMMDELNAWHFEAKVKEILGKMNIHHLQSKMNELSGGQRKRVALAKTLIDIGFDHKHTLLMMDEPSLGLAPLIVRDVFNIIKEIHKTGVTILLIEQNARAALQIADYGYVMETGTIVLQGSGQELAANEEVRKA